MLCIIQDTTSAKTINERLTLNLPASTTLSKLYEDVAHKAGYVTGTFELAWGNLTDMVRKSTDVNRWWLRVKLFSTQKPSKFSV